MKAALNLANEISEETEVSNIQMMNGSSKEHQHAADAMQDGHPARGGQAVGGEVCQRIDVAKFRPLFGKLCHGMAFKEKGGMRAVSQKCEQPKILLQCSKLMPGCDSCVAPL